MVLVVCALLYDCRLLMLVIVIGNISEICAQFKVIKMESQRSLTLEDESTSAALKNVTYITHFVKGNRSKYRRDSNVTVIQIMPSEKLSRRIKEIIAPATEETTKIASNISSSYHEIITVTPTSSNDTSNLLKLHILSLRMGKIQENMRPKPFRKKPTGILLLNSNFNIIPKPQSP